MPLEYLSIPIPLIDKITNYLLSVNSAEKPNREAFEIILELNRIAEQMRQQLEQTK